MDVVKSSGVRNYALKCTAPLFSMRTLKGAVAHYIFIALFQRQLDK